MNKNVPFLVLLLLIKHALVNKLVPFA